ncbi:MAG: hypothetical protein PHH54_06475 [Candidatus Nanoarchaeia archaeon]|nr:hypothetical protein [Candidatus Nanoarchaeia archaeon]MDD5741601.1 hypothetical protein [Candidatus Nanoarchaeia archaeon]
MGWLDGHCEITAEDLDPLSEKNLDFIRGIAKEGEDNARKIDSIGLSSLEKALRETESEKQKWDKMFPCYIFQDIQKINMLKSVIDLKKELLVQKNKKANQEIIEAYINNHPEHMYELGSLNSYINIKN